MKLTEYKTIDLSGYEIATLLGILRYVIDYKNLGESQRYAKDLMRKLKKLAESEE